MILMISIAKGKVIGIFFLVIIPFSMIYKPMECDYFFVAQTNFLKSLSI